MYLHFLLLKSSPSLCFLIYPSIPPLFFFPLFAPLSPFLLPSFPFLSSVDVLFALISLLFLLLLILLDEKCLVERAKELRRGNVDYVVIVVLILHALQIVMMFTTFKIVVLQLLLFDTWLLGQFVLSSSFLRRV